MAMQSKGSLRTILPTQQSCEPVLSSWSRVSDPFPSPSTCGATAPALSSESQANTGRASWEMEVELSLPPPQAWNPVEASTLLMIVSTFFKYF